MKDELKRIADETHLELDKISNWINSNKLDFKVNYLNAYSVIKASGTIERIFKSMIYDRMSEGANDETCHYLTKKILDASYNVSFKKIQNILEGINPEWFKELKSRVSQKNNLQNDLNSLIQLRNTFAHGNSINESIDAIIGYYESGMLVLEELDKVINNQ